MGIVLNFNEIDREKKRKDIIARWRIQEEITKFAESQKGHHLMWAKVKRLMLNGDLKHVKLGKVNLQIWLKSGTLIFDICNEDAISVDHDCPFCGEDYREEATILFIHPGLRHERHVYACKCGRFYSILWEN